MSLFQGIVKDRSNANIGWMNDKSPFYENGYRLAAEKLALDYEKLQVQEKDSLIFDILHFRFTVCHLDEGEILMLRAIRSLAVRTSLSSG